MHDQACMAAVLEQHITGSVACCTMYALIKSPPHKVHCLSQVIVYVQPLALRILNKFPGRPGVTFTSNSSTAGGKVPQHNQPSLQLSIFRSGARIEGLLALLSCLP